MADRRMLSKTVVETDNFLDLSIPAQALYFHLTMEADDDGFLCTVRSTARSIGVTVKEITELQEAGLLFCFDSGVALIRHWLIANTIRADRRHETQFSAERAMVTLDSSGVYCLRSEMEDDNIDDETNADTDADNRQPSSAPSPASAEVAAAICQPTDNQTPRIDNHLQTEDKLSKGKLREDKGSEEKLSQEKEREGLRNSLPRSDEDADTAKDGKQAGERDALSQDSGTVDALSTGQNAAGKPAGNAAGKNNAAQQAVKPFVPPTAAEVAAFCRKEGISLDAERFCSFYASKGWTVGSQPMRDWQASVRTWALRDRPQQKNKPELKPTVAIPGMLEL